VTSEASTAPVMKLAIYIYGKLSKHAHCPIPNIIFQGKPLVSKVLSHLTNFETSFGKGDIIQNISDNMMEVLLYILKICRDISSLQCQSQFWSFFTQKK